MYLRIEKIGVCILIICAMTLVSSNIVLAKRMQFKMVSRSSGGGAAGNEDSVAPAISGDGRVIAFSSFATNLIVPDGPAYCDVFVHVRGHSLIFQISVSSSGEQGNNVSNSPSISYDGRYVAFASLATNLVLGDTNDKRDIFIRDRLTEETERVSISSAGNQANNHCAYPSISADGRYVAFLSSANNLVANDTNDSQIDNVFVRDRDTIATQLVSISSSGDQANGTCYQPMISADGRFVVFWSSASNLVPNDTNDNDDIFCHDRNTLITELVSVSSSEEQANSGSFDPSISADGRYVAFSSYASNLVEGDTNSDIDVFVRDRHLTTTQRVSIAWNGEEADSDSSAPFISPDGDDVIFASYASNLVSNDTNGVADIFVQNRFGRPTIQRVSVSAYGTQPEWHCRNPVITASGYEVVFTTASTNLVDDDNSTLAVDNVFLGTPFPFPNFNLLLFD